VVELVERMRAALAHAAVKHAGAASSAGDPGSAWQASIGRINIFFERHGFVARQISLDEVARVDAHLSACRESALDQLDRCRLPVSQRTDGGPLELLDDFGRGEDFDCVGVVAVGHDLLYQNVEFDSVVLFYRRQLF